MSSVFFVESTEVFGGKCKQRIDDFKKVEKRKLVNVGFFSQEANASDSASPGENAALAFRFFF